MRWNRWPLQAEAGSDGGSGGSGVDIEGAVGRILAKKDAEAAVGDLLKDNFRQREEIRALKEKVKAAPTVPEGGVVLTAEQAAAWKSYQELGKPDDLKKAGETKAELEGKLAKIEHERTAGQAAEATGYRASVLVKLPGADALRYEVREEGEGDKKAKVAYVTEPGEGKAPRKLEDYAKETWGDFLSSLTEESEGRSGGSGGTPFPKQQDKGRGGGKVPTDDDIYQSKRARYASL